MPRAPINVRRWEPIIIDAKGVKHDWRLELIEKLQAGQSPDGSWLGTQKWMENRPILSTTFGVLLCKKLWKT